MKKQLEIELKALAQAILDSDSGTDINDLKHRAAVIYEHLCVLAYARSNSNQIETTNDISEAKAPENSSINQTQVSSLEDTTIVDNNYEIDSETIVPDEKSPELLFELEELTAGFEHMPEFERATPIANETTTSKINETISKPKSSLNESLKKGIQIGLNDRLAFVKHLFNNSQEDYTRVISQLNTLTNSIEASNFISQMVKPEYNNWEGKEAYEERFINVVFTKFED